MDHDEDDPQHASHRRQKPVCSFPSGPEGPSFEDSDLAAAVCRLGWRQEAFRCAGRMLVSFPAWSIIPWVHMIKPCTAGKWRLSSCSMGSRAKAIFSAGKAPDSGKSTIPAVHFSSAWLWIGHPVQQHLGGSDLGPAGKFKLLANPNDGPSVQIVRLDQLARRKCRYCGQWNRPYRPGRRCTPGHAPGAAEQMPTGWAASSRVLPVAGRRTRKSFGINFLPVRTGFQEGGVEPSEILFGNLKMGMMSAALMYPSIRTERRLRAGRE